MIQRQFPLNTKLRRRATLVNPQMRRVRVGRPQGTECRQTINLLDTLESSSPVRNRDDEPLRFLVYRFPM